MVSRIVVWNLEYSFVGRLTIAWACSVYSIQFQTPGLGKTLRCDRLYLYSEVIWKRFFSFCRLFFEFRWSVYSSSSQCSAQKLCSVDARLILNWPRKYYFKCKEPKGGWGKEGRSHIGDLFYRFSGMDMLLVATPTCQIILGLRF